ncbi:hypothetical protein Ahy_A02g008229 [Arachis hypogaea]|uniref:Uncharacterized protein n=1 Tax=Arachis hypogaea TaxID=3818 RepID=A0A445EE09_ARAHY|nr:hypothetical protein Ahy_A02g008229 [Arachis hypogaea]
MFHKIYDKELTFEKNLKRKPAGIDANHWKRFIEYRLKEDTQEQRQGRPIGRGEIWAMSQRKRMILLGKEHPGRVRGLGFGPCPSQCFRNIPQQSDYGVQIKEYKMEIVKLKTEATELKAAAAEKREKRQRMKAEAAEEKAKMQTMENLLRYLIQQQGGNLPPEIAADLDSLRSAPTSSQAR